MDIKRCFEILEVDELATSNDVKKSYLDLAYVWDPNKFIKNSRCYHKVLEKMKEIDAAYYSLKQYFLFKEEAAAGSTKAANDDDKHVIVRCVNY